MQGTAAVTDAAHSTPVVGDLQLRRTRPRQAHVASFDILPMQTMALRRPDFGHEIVRAVTSPLPTTAAVASIKTDHEIQAAAPASPSVSFREPWDELADTRSRRTMSTRRISARYRPMSSSGSSYGDSYWDDDREVDTRRTSLISSPTLEAVEARINQHGYFAAETRECTGPRFLERRRSSGWSKIVDWCDEQLDVIAPSKRRRSISPMMISAPRPSLTASFTLNASDPFAAE